MKKGKLIIILLFCIMLCACNATDGSEIVGEWKAQWQDPVVIFYEDGTGVLEYNGTINLNWEYQLDSETYVITLESNGKSYETSITTEDFLRYEISFAGGEFYRFDS